MPLFLICLVFTVANPSSQTHILLEHKPLNGGQFKESQADFTILIEQKLINMNKNNLFGEKIFIKCF